MIVHERDAAWQGEAAMRIGNRRVSLTVLRRGGMLAAFALTDARGRVATNALWEAPWFGERSGATDDASLLQEYGDVGTGRFLERFTGHALCLDGFGPATAEEVHAGSALHGEASIVDWQLNCDAPAHGVANARLPLAQLVVEREFSVEGNEPVVRVLEHITNLADAERKLHWVQHATVGPPMFSENSVIATSAQHGITWPLAYEDVAVLQQDAQFDGMCAPTEAGTSLDLRKLFAVPHAGFVAAMHQPEGREFGFVAAVNPREQLALVYVFSALLFPWLTLWEENECRQEWPWLGRVKARGVEFGTTPFPLGNAAVDAAGDVLGSTTSHPLSARAAVDAAWIMALVKLPESCGAIEDVIVGDHALVIRCKARTLEIEAHGIRNFLSRAGDEDE